MTANSIPEHLVKLLTSSIEAVERLDIVLYFRANPGRSYGARAIAKGLGGSVGTIEKHLAILCGRGFLTVSIGADLLFAYQPVSASVHTALGEIEKLNRESRAELVSTLEKHVGHDSAQTFANAVLMKKPTDGGR